MRLLVCQQAALPIKRLLTNVTLERLFVTMTVRVIQEAASRMKSFAAYVAYKGHFSRMDYQMGFQIPFLVEPLFAECAGVRFLRVVCQLVCLKIAFMFELLPTDFTVKRFLVKVYAPVALEIVHISKRAITNLTAIFEVFGVCQSVSVGYFTVSESFMADITLVDRIVRMSPTFVPQQIITPFEPKKKAFHKY